MKSPPTAPESSSKVEDLRWFVEEVYPHGTQLKSYLRGAFPTVRDVDDVVQESYARIWKTRFVRPIHSAKAFLFEVARRLVIDSARRQRRSPIEVVPDPDSLDIVADGPGVADAICTREEIALLARAFDTLPTRCREIMVLRQIEGLSQKEIAARLGLSELTVQTQVVLGLRRLRAFFERHGSSVKLRS